MESEKKEIRIRVEAPTPENSEVPAEERKSLPWIYWMLILLSIVFSSAGLYLAILK